MGAAAKEARKRTAGPWLWPVVFIITGLVLLLDNFLLLGDFDSYTLLPLLLVIAGAQVLLRGDLVPSTEGRTFGITRGSVQSGTLEISSGAVDVVVRGLQREGRLIAGQYAANARPVLNVEDTYVYLGMDRGSTPWYAFVDWHVAVARDLPWQVLVSTHLGRAHLDLEGVIVHDVVVATGLGEIRMTSPYEALGQVYLRSALGNIFLTTPEGYNIRVIIEAGRMFGVHADEERYSNPEPHVYLSREADPDAPLVEIRISGTFGEAYLV